MGNAVSAEQLSQKTIVITFKIGCGVYARAHGRLGGEFNWLYLKLICSGVTVMIYIMLLMSLNLWVVGQGLMFNCLVCEHIQHLGNYSIPEDALKSLSFCLLVSSLYTGTRDLLVSALYNGTRDPLVSALYNGTRDPLVSALYNGTRDPLVSALYKGTRDLVVLYTKGHETLWLALYTNGTRDPLVSALYNGTRDLLVSALYNGTRDLLVSALYNGTRDLLVSALYNGTRV
ncbi:hypothetical protein CEXT_194041 [Caerostris extrusa]|uniref:Uncharacterized protein n=1 Tax=Caerostris extrusa TaxID=172846 RepID=A0AAV4VN57_CAEEX|nr:hypothetical protein CEXT_194041 [Caerostris extrusa]